MTNDSGHVLLSGQSRCSPKFCTVDLTFSEQSSQFELQQELNNKINAGNSFERLRDILISGYLPPCFRPPVSEYIVPYSLVTAPLPFRAVVLQSHRAVRKFRDLT